jgi:hypothetical protein
VETQVGPFDDSGERWRSRPALSALVSVGVFVVPIAAAIGSADVVARLVPKPTAVSLLVGGGPSSSGPRRSCWWWSSGSLAGAGGHRTRR